MQQFFETLNFMFAISCDKATRLMSDSMERKLTFVEKFALIGHMAACKTSRRFRRQLKGIRHELQIGLDSDEASLFSGLAADDPSAFSLSLNARKRIQLELQQAEQDDK